MILKWIFLVFLSIQSLLAQESDVYVTAFQERLENLTAADRTELEDDLYRFVRSLDGYVEFGIESISRHDRDIVNQLQSARCLYANSSLNLSAYCLNYLRTRSPATYQALLRLVLDFQDEDAPSYFVGLDTNSHRLLLDSTIVRRFNARPVFFRGLVDVTSLLNPALSKLIWTVPRNELNCFASAFASITPNARLFYRDTLWLGRPPAEFTKYPFNNNLQFGDLIEFEIRGDGHAVTYLGKDNRGEMYVLTKNGFMPSFLQVMKYSDVYERYREFNITHVNVWRYSPDKEDKDLTHDLVRKISNPHELDNLYFESTVDRMNQWLLKR
jgi:hypothetical protein